MTNNVLTYESVKLIKRADSKKHSNESIEINTHLILMMG